MGGGSKPAERQPQPSSNVVDTTRGYSSGDQCMGCGRGLITVRTTQESPKYPSKVVKYAQCSECSWNTLPK